MTVEGLQLTVELFFFIGKVWRCVSLPSGGSHLYALQVNQMSAYGFLSMFDQVDKFAPAVKAVLVATLRKMRAGLDPKLHESLYNQLGRLLK